MLTFLPVAAGPPPSVLRGGIPRQVTLMATFNHTGFPQAGCGGAGVIHNLLRLLGGICQFGATRTQDPMLGVAHARHQSQRPIR